MNPAVIPLPSRMVSLESVSWTMRAITPSSRLRVIQSRWPSGPATHPSRVACGPAGKHPTYPKSGHRHTKDPSSGTSTWYERQVLSDVTLAQPLQVIAFSGAKPPLWAKPYATCPSHDSFTFQAQTDGQVRLALVGVREADDAVIVVTKQ